MNPRTPSLRPASSLRLRPAAVVVTALGALALASCAPAEPIADDPGPATGEADSAVTPGSVYAAVKSSCTTSTVAGLSQQIIAEGNCLAPGAFAALPDLANLSFEPNVFRYLEQPARDALVKALTANPGKKLHVNSMLRTVAQQYLLSTWYQLGTCGIGLAAKPGKSNHETGLAFDTDDYASDKSLLAAVGFQWFGGGDAPHFDYAGKGAVDHRGLDVKAFQRLWNRNHPEDTIDEDGVYGPNTEARLRKSPAAGFPKGASCDGGGAGGAGGGDAGGAGGAGGQEQGGQGGQAQGGGCGEFEGHASFTCSADGNGRGRCVGGQLDYEACARGCLRDDQGGGACMGTQTSWSCDGLYGTDKASNGDYYSTEFGCWKDANGNHGDPGDNCIPTCLKEAQGAGLCAGLSGPACERAVSWYAADGARFGCLARLRVTNPKNGKAVVVAVLDFGPSCSVEDKASHAAIDLSYPASKYLFGGPTGISDKALAHVVEVDPSTPLGPVQ
jgi:hypothetical protein